VGFAGPAFRGSIATGVYLLSVSVRLRARPRALHAELGAAPGQVSAGAVQDLVAKGAAAAASPAQVARQATTIVTMLPSPKIVDDLFMGDAGLLATAATGTLFIDCSTIDPGTAQRIAAASAAKGHRFVDAPVSVNKDKTLKGP